MLDLLITIYLSAILIGFLLGLIKFLIHVGSQPMYDKPRIDWEKPPRDRLESAKKQRNAKLWSTYG